MATRTFSGSTDATDLRSTRTVTLYGSGSVGNTINSATIRFGLSTNAYGPSYTISIQIGSAYVSYVAQLDSSNYSQAYFTAELSGISGVDWSSSQLTMSISCTSTSGSKANIFVKGSQIVTVESTSTDSGGGDSGGSSDSGSGSTIYASSISLNRSVATVGDTITCTISPTNSSNYHKISWLIGNQVISGPTTLSAGTTTSSITITQSHMAYIPSSTSDTLVCNVQTYGSDGTSAGYAASQCTINVPSTYVPSFNISLNPDSSTLRNGYYYQNITIPGISITGISAGYGANLSSYSIMCTGMSSVSGTNTNASITYRYSIAISASGTCTFTVTITDTRRRSTTKTINFTVLSYLSPTVGSYDTYRCTSSGTSISSGTCLRIVLTNVKVGNTTDSSLKLSSIVVRYKLTTDSSYSSTALSITNINAQTYNLDRVITSPTFSINNNYDIRIDITDTFGATVYLYDRIFRFSGVLFDMCGASGNEAVGIGEAVTGVSGANQRLVINGNWDIWYKGDNIANYFVKVSDIIGNVGSIRKIYYGPTAPSNPTAGSIWIKESSN